MKWKELSREVRLQLLEEWKVYAKENHIHQGPGGPGIGDAFYKTVMQAWLTAAAKYYPTTGTIRERMDKYLSSERGQQLIITLSA